MKTMPNQDSFRRMIQRWFPNFPNVRVVEIHTDTAAAPLWSAWITLFGILYHFKKGRQP
jgi:hypothetical protein